jgi:hypothetical protein
MNRRQLLNSAGLAGIGAAILVGASGCGLNITGGGTSALTTIISYADEFTASVGTIISDAKAFVSDAVYSQLSADYALLQSADKIIDSLTSSTNAESAVSSFAGIINKIVAALSTIPGLPAAVTLGLSALSIALPILENLVGITPSTKNPKLAFVEMTQDQAMVILKGLATRYNVTHPN